MTTEKELIVIEEQTALQHFNSEEGLKPLIAQVEELVFGFEHNLETAAGRKKTASLSAKVSKLKTKIDGMGKDLVADWKAKSKKVDATRKEFRDRMDELRDIARQPLTDFEAEEERKVAEEKARLEAEALAEKKESDHEIALLIDREFDRLKAEEAAELKRQQEEAEAERVRQQAEREKQIAAQAKAEAEAREKAAIEAKEKAERDAIVAAELAKAQSAQAERDRIAAAAKAEQDRIAAEAKAKADAQAAAEAARLAEIARQEDEAKRLAAEKAKLEKDRAHASKIMGAAKEHLMLVTGVDEDLAKAIVKHIHKNKINEISINF